ncbi:PREDICTED: protein arginine N-methyltransferase 1.6 isoform X1 [Lupinus angustifolius]|uniref:protein arginine N-methyltransferase 1.6 isoform X1 n=1 Tax=Lupinus angustifolius TaxID=3871 RepID=UPI00092E55AF|nr:PREDICTED: protein arginine N-methyltransferase 1.6 isoform X1 [Lupinus angustifolius]
MIISLFLKTLIPISRPFISTLTPIRSNFIRTMSSNVVFQLKLHPLTGNSEWVVIQEDQNDDVQQPLLATTSYLDMLNDSARNRAYRQAIEKTITKPSHVLDIGAGTGLLSMMAARAMGSKGRVTACESYLPMVKLMKKVMRVNGMGGRIKVINKRSDELQVGGDIPSRADVLVSEILDSELLGEGLIPTLQHAHDNLLSENPLTVPYRATTYGQLVESSFLRQLHDLHNNEASVPDDICLTPPGLEGVLSVKRQQYAMHCDPIRKEIKLLSEPFKIFEFDFWKRPESYGESELCVKATNDGRVHAVVSWWVLQLDREGTIYYSTAPRWISSATTTSPIGWCDHWKQCVWFVPGNGISISKGEEICLHATHTDTTISYNFDTRVSTSEVSHHGMTAENFQLVLSPERAAIYGDKAWRLSMLKAVESVLQGRVRSLCLVADDSVFLPLLVAHLSEASHVISLLPGLKERGLQYLLGVAHDNHLSPNHIEVLGKRAKQVTLDDTDQKKVDLLIAEPFYFGNDGMLPWQNLRFWKDRTSVDSILSEDALIIPSKGILKACAISLPDLWKSRCCLSKIEGFDHSVVNGTLGACGNLPDSEEGPCLPFFVWQCGEYDVLSEAFDVMEFDFSKQIHQCEGKSKVNFTKSGVCHGFVLWIDWVMDLQNSVVISTGPDKRYWKQGVKLLATPKTVGPEISKNAQACYSAVLEAIFNPSNGDLKIVHEFL